jgi:hypothetical protein
VSNKYKIKFTYNTGNTFETEDGVQGFISYEFDSLALAKQALARMKEHYLWRLSKECAYEESKPVPEWYKRKDKNWGSEWYFNVPGNDEEEVWLYGGEYLGYFETLVCAEIVAAIPGSDGMRFGIF